MEYCFERSSANLTAHSIPVRNTEAEVRAAPICGKSENRPNQSILRFSTY